MRTDLALSSFVPRRVAAVLLALAVSWLLGGGPAHADDSPVLRIETGAHAGMLLGFALSPGGERLATAANDGTVRLWSFPGLELLRTIRMPRGPSIEGAVYSVDVSPDGRTLVTSGWTGGWGSEAGPWCIYVIDAASADMRRTICDLPQRINQVGFSPDGRFIVAVLKAGAGIRIYRADDYSLFKEDRDYQDAAIAFDFDKTGHMAVSALDGHLRLYDKDFRKIADKTLPEGRKPHGIAFSPDGSKLAVGYAEPEGDDPPWRPAIDVVAAADLAVLPRPDVRGMGDGALWRVAWSADGSALYAGGTWAKGDRFPVRRWSDGGKGRPTDLPVAAQRIVRMKGTDAGVLYSTETGDFGLLGPDNTVIAERHTGTADYTDIGDVLAVSPDGSSVQFAFEPEGRKVAHFSLATRLLEPGESPAAAQWAHQVTDNPNLDIRDWTWSYRPTLNGKPLEMRPHDQSLAMTVTPDGKGLVLATSWQLVRYDGDGKVLWTHEVSYGRGVTITPDGHLLVAALGDGTIRWYAMDTGTELLAFFPDADGERWIAWTPSGYYMSSVGGGSLIGWQVNRGHEQTADFFSVDRFSDKYYRPDIVMRTLAERDEAKAIRAAEAETGRQVSRRSVAELLPPVIDIIDPPDGAAIDKPEIDVRYRVRSPSGQPVTQILVRSDDHPLGTFDPPALDAKGQAWGDLHLIVPQRDSRLLVFASNAFATSDPAELRLKWTGARLDITTLKRKLYVLAIGVSDYADPRLKLGYAAKDAHDVVAALERQNGTAYTDVEAKIVTDSDATLDGVRRGIAWLDNSATVDDIGMIFLAGHGFDATDGSYYYLPRDADPDRLPSTALPYVDLLAGLKGIKGSAVLFIDTCHAGDALGRPGTASMDVIGLVSRLSQPSNGVVVFASSSGSQSSLESKAWGNGAFTKAVVEGLDGAAEYGKRDYITTTMLETYVKERVKDLTAARQTPTVNMPLAVPDLMLAAVKN